MKSLHADEAIKFFIRLVFLVIIQSIMFTIWIKENVMDETWKSVWLKIAFYNKKKSEDKNSIETVLYPSVNVFKMRQSDPRQWSKIAVGRQFQRERFRASQVRGDLWGQLEYSIAMWSLCREELDMIALLLTTSHKLDNDHRAIVSLFSLHQLWRQLEVLESSSRSLRIKTFFYNVNHLNWSLQAVKVTSALKLFPRTKEHRCSFASQSSTETAFGIPPFSALHGMIADFATDKKAKKNVITKIFIAKLKHFQR